MTTRRTKKSRAEETADPVLLPTWQDLHEMASAIPGHQERLLFCLYAYTGARASELMAVEPGDLLPAHARDSAASHLGERGRRGMDPGTAQVR